jgi:hypothetical protein
MRRTPRPTTTTSYPRTQAPGPRPSTRRSTRRCGARTARGSSLSVTSLPSRLCRRRCSRRCLTVAVARWRVARRVRVRRCRRRPGCSTRRVRARATSRRGVAGRVAGMGMGKGSTFSSNSYAGASFFDFLPSFPSFCNANPSSLQAPPSLPHQPPPPQTKRNGGPSALPVGRKGGAATRGGGVCSGRARVCLRRVWEGWGESSLPSSTCHSRGEDFVFVEWRFRFAFRAGDSVEGVVLAPLVAIAVAFAVVRIGLGTGSEAGDACAGEWSRRARDMCVCEVREEETD